MTLGPRALGLLLGALPREPIQALEVFHAEPVEVAAALDEPGLEELFEDLPAGTLDVHPAAPHDSDHDGVPNRYDRAPYDPNRR